MQATLRSEFFERVQELERLGFTLGKRSALNERVKGLLVWYYGTAWPSKSPLQVPAQAIRQFRIHYLAIA